MDDLRLLTNKHSYLQLSSVLHKQLKAIRAHKAAADEKAKSTTNSGASSSTTTRHRDQQLAGCKEHEQLKLQCMSDNVQLSQLSFQACGTLIKEGTLDAAVAMSMFASMVPGAGGTQLMALSEAVIQLLLQDLKQRNSAAGGQQQQQTYVCPFVLQTPQHPLLAFVQHAQSNVPDLVGKIVQLCRKHDKDLRRNVCEFLRPVFLFVFCNPARFADTGPLWTQLLEQSRKDEKAQQLVLEVLGWCNLSSDATLLQTANMLCETILLHHTDTARSALTLELCLYLVHLLPALIASGFNPLHQLTTITTYLQLPTTAATAVAPYANVLLTAVCTHILPICAPAHLPDLCSLLRHLCLTLRAGNAVTLRMLLSALLNWLAAPQLLRTDCLQLLHGLVRHVTAGKWRKWAALPATPAAMRVQHFHPACAFSVHLARNSEHLCGLGGACGAGGGRDCADPEALGAFHRLTIVRPQFCHRINLYMRALFLLERDAVEPRGDAESNADVATALLQSTLASGAESTETFMTWLYRTLNERDGYRLMRLLRGLTVFGGVRENIPRIVAALRTFAGGAGRMQPMALELYFSLWRAEARTWVYLWEELLRVEARVTTKEGGGKKEQTTADWELNVARAMTIHDICKMEPFKHGTELIVHLSHILNTCTDEDGETATCVALQTITGLCSNQVINIASTWKALLEMFRAERRERALIVQCEFFAAVPLLANPSAEYDECLDDGLRFLWRSVHSSPLPGVRVAALKALQNYDYTTLTYGHVPAELWPKSYIPPPPATDTTADDQPPPPPPITGDFWPHLVEQLNDGQHETDSAADVSAACADLINHYIHCELRTFRQHLYQLGDGHVEPLNYNRLPSSAASPLRACVKALLAESNKLDYERDRHTIRYVLRALTERLQRALPPLNWFWIVELMSAASDSYQASEETLETRAACLRLVVHQQMHSESARQIVEDYFAGFAADSAGDDEMRLCIGLFGAAAQGLTVRTLSRWLECTAIYSWAFGQQNGFDEDSYFGLLLNSCAQFFARGEPGEAVPEADEESENFGLVVRTLAEYYAHFVHDFADDEQREQVEMMFGRFQAVFVPMQAATVDRIVVPRGWPRAAVCRRMWRRALHSCRLLVQTSEVRKSLRWLNAAVENINPELQSMLFQNVDAALGAATDERDACLWAMDILSVIQAFLTASTQTPATIAYNVVMRVRLFCTTVVVRAGFERLRTPEDGDDWRLNLFPVALLHLFEHASDWREQETRIYEFFYNLFTNAADILPAEYLELIRQTFVCARSRPYFGPSAVWRKMVGLRVVPQ